MKTPRGNKYLRVSLIVLAIAVFPLSSSLPKLAETLYVGKFTTANKDSLVMPNVQQRVQRAGNINMCQTNWGTWGSQGRMLNESSGGCFNPHPDSEMAAPSFEFPKYSGLDYLFWGGLWVGAIIDEMAYVSVGLDGWQWNHELFPDGPTPLGAIEERSKNLESPCYWENAFSDQEVIACYTDTLVWETIWDRYPFWNYIDGRWHRPLNVRVTQKTYSWEGAVPGDFIIADYRIENIGSEVLSHVYVALFLDTDICNYEEPYGSQGFTDDITGFLKQYEVAPGDIQDVGIAWAADNNGWVDYDDELHWSVRSVFGVKILDVSRPDIGLSYNWWISHTLGLPKDWGPWKIENQGRWAQENCYAPGDSFFPNHALGTPDGDCSKYFMMSNGEIDYDQIYSCVWGSTHSEEGWLAPNELCHGFAHGADTKFLLSLGPFLQISPGDSIHFVAAYLIGEDFHIDPDNGENLPANPDTFYAHVDFSDLVLKALTAQRLYDSLFSTPTIVDEPEHNSPEDFSLHQNFPNPFNPDTKIRYAIAGKRKDPMLTTLKIYNILGQLVRTLVDEPQKPGTYEVIWDGRDQKGNDIVSGIYFYQLKAGEFRQTKKMVLIR